MNEIFSEMLKMSEDLILNVRCRLPRNGAILAENDFVILKAISEDQKDNIMKVSYECSFAKREFENEIYRNYLQESFIDENAVYYCINNKSTKEFIGYCGVKNLTKEIPELVIELLPNCRKQGYGFQALSLFMSQLAKITGETLFRSRITIDNIASQDLHKKLGALPNGISEIFLHGEKLIEYQMENQYLIDDNIRKLAADFNVEPIELLGHVLEYIIEWK